MKCLNRQFGEVEFDQDHVFTFAEGLIGFEHLKRFVLIHDQNSEPFRWLVSIDDEDVSLPMIDPELLVERYNTINAFRDGDIVAVVASLKDPIEESTVNLRSPLVFDARSRTGMQIILPDERFAVQYRFIAAPQVVAGVE